MDIEKIRKDFPVAQKYTYMDSACMALKPKQVIDAMNRYYTEFPACGERSSHKLGNKVTEECEESRKKVAKFIGAKKEEVIFTKNTTEGLNLAAHSLLERNDIVITSDKEHNSNLLPWLNFNHRFVPTKDGVFDTDAFQEAMNKNVKVVSLLHTSNIDGVSFPIEKIAKIVHDNDSILVVDGAQSVPHREIDVKRLGCDVLAFSGHKMLGPSIGCVYIKKEIAETMKPFMTGGGTVANVVDGVPSFLPVPEVFEAGLQNYAGAIGLRAAIEYLESVGMNNIQKHEHALNKMMTENLLEMKNVSIISEGEERGGIVSFNIEGIDSKEAAIMLDSYNVLVRGGYHCCHNWFNMRKINGSVRASMYFYNNEQDAEAFLKAVKKVVSLS